jgi:hypothetical protein
MKFKISIRDAFLSTALIVAGIGVLLAFYRLPPHIQAARDASGWVALALYLLSGSLIGAGITLPFGGTWFGLVWGYLVMLALYCR